MSLTQKEYKGPPKDVPASELWALITQMPRASRLVDYPMKDPVTGDSMGQVVMIVLTQQEQTIAQVSADRYAREVLKEVDAKSSPAWDDVYKNAAAVEVLYRCCKRSEDPSQPFFPSPKVMREKMTSDEIGVLLAAYYQVQAELGPIVAHLTVQEKEAWISRLSEGGAAFPLASLSWEVMSDLMLFMARQLHSLQTDKYSPGLRLEDSESEQETASET